MQVTSGEMSNTLCRETPHFSRLVFLKTVFFSKGIFLRTDIPQDYPYSKRVFPKGGTLKSASLFDAVAHADAVAQITCEGERWILRLKGSNGCQSLCR